MGDRISADPISEQPPAVAADPAAPSSSAEVTKAHDSSTDPEGSSAVQAPPSEPPATQAEQPVPVRHKGLSFLQPGTRPGSLGRLGHFEGVRSQAVEPRKSLSGKIAAVSSSRDLARILP